MYLENETTGALPPRKPGGQVSVSPMKTTGFVISFESDNRLKVFFSMPNFQADRRELGVERLGRGTRQGMHFACS